ncbi:MAG: glycosyltransferase family 4 protein [Paludibacteraceae bacterium]|nr:glycosyltransferase family 4 protein [Paludibacteraceae bacterium]MBP5664522.1 glycosyltransferase family 4 protein [Bacteroidales bacterium]
MTKVLVLSTSKRARGGIAAVLKLYEQSDVWKKYHCRWVSTHKDSSKLIKIWYLCKGMIEFLFLLPFYDIVHIHFSLAGSARRKYPFFRIAKKMGKKVIIHLHCGSQIDDIWNHTYQTMFEQCDCGILLSESLKSKIEEHIGKSDKLKVVYNPCPIVPNNTEYEKKNHILFSGTLYDGKGYKDLINAFARVAAKYPNWKIVFAGNGEVEQARALSEKLGISKQVLLLGWVSGEAKHKAFSEAKALCLPSYAEGFPMAVLDAWAYGLPVVTTPVGGVPDVAVDRENMLLFEPGDVDQLAVQLGRVINDEALRVRLSEESAKMAQNQFNLVSITNQVGDIYKQIVKTE